MRKLVQRPALLASHLSQSQGWKWLASMAPLLRSRQIMTRGKRRQKSFLLWRKDMWHQHVYKSMCKRLSYLKVQPSSINLEDAMTVKLLSLRLPNKRKTCQLPQIKTGMSTLKSQSRCLSHLSYKQIPCCKNLLASSKNLRTKIRSLPWIEIKRW